MINKHLEYANYSSKNDKAFMVGDNSKDIDAAHNAGITSMFVTWGFSESGEANYIFKDPDELVDVVLNKT